MMENLETKLNQSLGWIAGQRWFGDKDRSLRDVSIEHLALAQDGDDPIQLCILRCRFAKGDDAMYFLPVVGSQGDDLRDAFTVEQFRSWFFRGFVEHRELEGTSNTWRWEVIEKHQRDVQHVNPDVSSALRLEQSNTSVVYDRRLIAKVFRKLETGPNPDVEIGTMFARSTANAPVPELAGTVTIGDGEDATVLAILQQYVHNLGDGWGWLLGQLRNQTSGSISAIGLLGRRTAEMHTALASGSNDPSFDPESVTLDDLAAMQSRIASELDLTMSGLRDLNAIDERGGNELHAKLQQRIASLDALKGTMKIRIHGDYHLGQVLRTVENDFRIIDFEGEPSRPMEERRKKWPALRDVAGMVRSLDYAVQTVLREQPERIDLAQWRDDAARALVTEYRAAVKPPRGIVPSSDTDFEQALAVFVLEKALYETRYEMSNRPDWLEIPLGALRRIAGD